MSYDVTLSVGFDNGDGFDVFSKTAIKQVFAAVREVLEAW